MLFIPDPDFDLLPIPDPGSRGFKGTGSRIRVRNTGFLMLCCCGVSVLPPAAAGGGGEGGGGGGSADGALFRGH